MIKYILTAIICLFALSVQSKTVRIAVLDTGYDFKSDWKWAGITTKPYDGKKLRKPKICKKGHKDFTKTGITDTNGHGTHVAGIIARYAEDSDYCLVIIKTFSKLQINSSYLSLARGLIHASRLGVDIINYSGGGKNFSIHEYKIIKKILDKGIIVVVAAGNEGDRINYNIYNIKMNYHDHDGGDKTISYGYKISYINVKTGNITTKKPKYAFYPANYDMRIIAVINIDKKGKVADKSNYGHAFLYKEVGESVLSILPGNSVGYMSGTSMSAPTRTGKIVKKWNK